MSVCRVCDSDLEPFINFGRMPLANGFLTADQFAGEFFFDLGAAYCRTCTLVQLVEQPQRERMFNDHYPFYSATSSRMAAHFEALAHDVVRMQDATGNLFLVEIGSNDGTLLQPVADCGIRHLGIEPSASVARAASARGVNTVCRFFDRDLAQEIVSTHGHADAVIAANALSHINDPHAVVAGIKLLLAPDGTCIVEDPYWGDVVAQTAFDQIYDEHASYFTLSSITNLFARHDLVVRDAIHFEVHGGSMRYLIGHAGRVTQADSMLRQLAEERDSGLHLPATFNGFRQRVDATGAALMTLLREHRSQGRRVVGYGATSKSTTSINYFGITPELVEFICDTTPAKHGTFSPGAHLPVRPHAEFARRYPDRALLFLWNHAAEVRAKETAFSRSGGRWIGYVPRVGEF